MTAVEIKAAERDARDVALIDAIYDALVTKDHLQAQLAEVKGEITLIKWMLGFNLAVSTAVLFKLLV